MKKLLLLIPVLFYAFLLQAQDEKKLLLYWSFDDGEATDLSDNGHDGDIYFAVSESETPLNSGKSMHFDATDCYILNETVVEELNGNKAFSVSIWVKSDEIDSDRGFFICNDPQNKDRDLTIRYDKAGYIGGGTNVIKAGISVTNDNLGDTVEFSQETISGVQSTMWTHVVFCWQDGDTLLTLYLNGEKAFDTGSRFLSSAIPDHFILDLPDSVHLTRMTKLLVGKGPKDAESSWLGYIDEVVILNYKVTKEEVDALHNGEVPLLGDGTAVNKVSPVNPDIKITPNPMKTSTRIEFSTNSQARVTIEIYNVCGETVQILTNKIYQPGIHSINWSPSNINSGVYFGKMKVNNKVETFKLIVQ